MTRPGRLDTTFSTRATAGVLSAVLHLGLILVILLAGGRRDGISDDDTPLSQLVFIASDVAGQQDGVALSRWMTAVPTLLLTDHPDLRDIEPPASRPIETEAPPEDMEEMPEVDLDALSREAVTSAIEPPSTFMMPRAQASALLRRLERLAEAHAMASRARIEWEQDGKRYDAELVPEPATSGLEPDRVVAQVSAEDRGRKVMTRIMLKRLPFTHYAQLIDRWDPAVQLHDDEIVGRMHINSRFNLLHDSEAGPTFLGKVSTAAGGFNMRSQGRRRESDVFREGIETRAERISLSGHLAPLEQIRRDRNARVHELADDTAIIFFADGSYSWRERPSDSAQFRAPGEDQSVYFIAARGASIRVKGTVAGRFLVYSPQRIVIEDSLIYARDPRDDPDSDDYLGLVCDKDIVVAPPYVTGPGDLHVHAALFAKRRIVVSVIDHSRPATLAIFGSLAAGSITASEPRYATKVEYDWRFERLRPPGFPSTDRFAAEDWDGHWAEVTDRSLSAAF